MHMPGAQGIKSMHPAAKMCTQGAGCTLNFEHCKMYLRIDNSGWSVNSSTLFDVAGMSWYQRKYHVLYIIRQPIINYLWIYLMIR